MNIIPNGDNHGGAVCDDPHVRICERRMSTSCAYSIIVINNWMRGKDTIEFLGLWEQLHNPTFKPIEFDRFRKEAGYNAFTLSPQKWIENTDAIGIVSKSGRYGGTFAHSDIAFEFASWISAEFKLYLLLSENTPTSNNNYALASEG